MIENIENIAKCASCSVHSEHWISFVWIIVSYTGSMLSILILVIYCFQDHFVQTFDLEKYSDNGAKLDKFVENQFYINCFGAKALKSMKSNLAKANTICKQKEREVTSKPVTLLTYPFQSLQMINPFEARPGYPASTFPLHTFRPTLAQEEQEPQVTSVRSKKSLNTKLEELKRKMTIKLKKISCVLNKSGITYSNGTIDSAGMKKSIDSLQLDFNLTFALKENIEMCEEAASCLPQAQFGKESGGETTGQAIQFLKCYEEKKKEACVKKSIREKLVLQLREDMTLEDVEKILSRGSTKSPMYYTALPLLEYESTIFDEIVDAMFSIDFQ